MGLKTLQKATFSYWKQPLNFLFQEYGQLLECKNKLIKRKDFTVNGDFTDVEQVIT